MVTAINWTSLGMSHLFNSVWACLYHIWSASVTQLFYLISKIGELVSSAWAILCWISRGSELVSAFAANRESRSEVPKAATEHDRWRALAKCSKHLLPVGVTASLLALNFSTIFWEAPGSSSQNARLNALQFAAKVHEILLVSSLSLIVLDHVQFELLRGGGVPVGGLFAGFQVGNVATLWKPGLWATASTTNTSTHGGLLVLLVVVSIIVGAVSGPSSAILMLPSLDWWTEPLTTSEVETYFGASSGLFIDAPPSSLWPAEITTSNFLPQDCNFTDGQIPIHCPAGGLAEMLAWGSVPEFGPTDWNLTMAAGQFERFIQGGSSGTGPSCVDCDWYMSQTTGAMVGNALAALFVPKDLPTDEINRWMISSSKGTNFPAPQTFVECDTTIYDALGPSFETDGSFDNTLHFPLNGAANNKTWSAGAKPLLDLWSATKTLGILWVEPPDLGDKTPSIGAAIMANRSYVAFGDGVLPSVYIVTCSVFAGWRPAEVYIGSTDAYVHSDATDGPAQTVEDWAWSRKNATELQQVKLDIDWANAALTPNETLGKVYAGLEFRSGPSPPLAFGPTLSVLITDALARIGMDSNVTLGRLVINHDSQIVEIDGSLRAGVNATEFELTRLRYGYGYSTRGITRRLAAGLLLTHVLIAMIHTAMVFWRGSVHSTFTSLFDVLALAINSTPTQRLENTCAGIARLDTYKHVVMIREVSNAHLGLVLDNEGGHLPPAEGKLYGATEVGGNFSSHLRKE